MGYLLKDRVAETSDFIDALTRVAAGGTALDPEVVTQLMAAGQRAQTIGARLTRRESEVLGLMAEGTVERRHRRRSSSSVRGPWKSTSPTSSPSSTCRHPAIDNRRVLAVLRYLNG